MIVVESKRRKIDTIKQQYPNAAIIDVTSQGDNPYVQLSPFYPHNGIPVPFSEGVYAKSVEGIWQGLKVFEGSDVDTSKFEITTMKGLKRTVAKFGKPKGHRKGVKGEELLGYIEARKAIYVPCYNWVLEHKVVSVLEELRALAELKELVLLDYETNGDIDNARKPLSHAYLVKFKLEENGKKPASL